MTNAPAGGAVGSGRLCVRGAGVYGTLCTFLSIFYKPKAALKIVFMKKKKNAKAGKNTV